MNRLKAIGIVGSPRKNGNVDTLVQAVLDGAEQAGYQTAAQAYEAAYNSVISVISGQDYSGITQI